MSGASTDARRWVDGTRGGWLPSSWSGSDGRRGSVPRHEYQRETGHHEEETGDLPNCDRLPVKPRPQPDAHERQKVGHKVGSTGSELVVQPEVDHVSQQ